METSRSPEQWEASEHIANLRKQYEHVLLNQSSDVCPEHNTLMLTMLPALIWIIRHTDREERRNGKAGMLLTLAKTSPLGVLGLGLILLAIVMGKIHGVFP